MWNCQFCETEVNESSDYCPTCEFAGCTKGEHHCCDKTMEAFTPSEIAFDYEADEQRAELKIKELDSYSPSMDNAEFTLEQENELRALLNHIYSKHNLDIKGIQAVNNTLALALQLWVNPKNQG